MTASPPPEECASRLLGLLTAQGGIFAQVREQAGRLMGHIEAGDTDSLMRVLAEKQRLMRRNDALQAEMRPWLEAWERVRERAGAGLRGPVEAALSVLQGHMAAICEMEDAARVRLEGAKKDTGEQVARMQVGKAMIRAYGPRPAGQPPPSRFSDSTS